MKWFHMKFFMIQDSRFRLYPKLSPNVVSLLVENYKSLIKTSSKVLPLLCWYEFKIACTDFSFLFLQMAGLINKHVLIAGQTQYKKFCWSWKYKMEVQIFMLTAKVLLLSKGTNSCVGFSSIPSVIGVLTLWLWWLSCSPGNRNKPQVWQSWRSATGCSLNSENLQKELNQCRPLFIEVWLARLRAYH